jgi:broad specificity phosphatase PhoE
MSPILHCVRHAQGFHNLDPHHEDTLSDPPLTQRGRDQCQRLCDAFPYHSDVDFVISSPLRRTIETTLLGFGKTISAKQLKVLLEPRCQETTAKPSDTGSWLGGISTQCGDVLDTSRVEAGWNSNTGVWEMTPENLRLHCEELHDFIRTLPYTNVLLVAHGSVSKYSLPQAALTITQFLETFTGHGGWHNTEFRSYYVGEDGLRETPKSQKLRRDRPQGGFRPDLGDAHENPMGL